MQKGRRDQRTRISYLNNNQTNNTEIEKKAISFSAFMNNLSSVDHCSREKNINQIKSVPADLLARAVAGLQSLVLPRADLTQEQVLAIFNTLDRPDFVRCQWVDLKNTDLSALEPSLMARVVTRLKVAEFYQCSLTR